MKKQAVGLLVLGCCLSGPVIAEGFTFIGRASSITFDEDDGFNPGTNAEAGFGYDFSEYFGLEAVYSASVSAGTIEAVPPVIPEDLENEFTASGLYAVFRTPGRFYLKAKAGSADIEQEIEGTLVGDDSSSAVGVGFGYKFEGGTRLELEGVRLNENEVNDVYAYSLGLNVPFWSPDGSSEIYRGLEDSKFYWGIGYGSGDLETEGGFGLDTHGLGLKFGREFGQYISFEAHMGSGADSSENILRDPEVSYGAAFLRMNLPFERVNLYAVGGLSRVSIDGGGAGNGSDEERAVGVGIDLFGSEVTALTIEKIRYGSDTTFDVLSVGITRRFDWPGLR